MFSPSPIIIVHRETRLEGVLRRWGTRGQAKFVIRQAAAMERARQAESTGAPVLARKAPLTAPAGADAYADLENEDQVYRESLVALQRELNLEERVQLVHRDYVPTFDFGLSQVVVVLGQDGMVANVAKYVGDAPIVGVNPDPARFDGVLLPFQVSQARAAVQGVLKRAHKTRRVTLAEALLNDGQRLLAFNDLFVGSASHVSARYALVHQGRAEQQSSSGIIVSTGAGSTGWLSSTRMSCTVPPFSALIGFMTFIASMISKVSPACTVWPLEMKVAEPGSGCR